MGWHLLETLLQQVGEHSTLVGKLWVTATFVFRFVIVASVGDAVYSDEQSDFNCNTGQPGCENVCFNDFSPISHLRFWAAQIIAVCTPSIVFVVYSAHILLKVPHGDSQEDFDDEEGSLPPDVEAMPAQPRGGRKSLKKGVMDRMPSTRSRPRTAIGMVRGFANPPRKATEAIENIREDDDDDDDDDEESADNSDDGVGTKGEKSLTEINEELEMLDEMEAEDKEKRIQKRIKFAYVVALLLRTGFEAVFLWLQYELYGFTVPERFPCERAPCPHVVDCFVSRPQEKTIFLWFMFIVSALCLLLNIIEIYYLGTKNLFKILCVGEDQSQQDEEKTENEDYSDDASQRSSSDHGSKASKRSYFRIDGRRSPSASTDTKARDLYNVVDYRKKKRQTEGDSENDSDPIGFNGIGSKPPYPTPGFPYVHRYGMLLNATPPPPSPPPPEVKQSYL